MRKELVKRTFETVHHYCSVPFSIVHRAYFIDEKRGDWPLIEIFGVTASGGSNDNVTCRHQ